MILQIIKILILAFIQNISFTLVSRSRNRNNKRFHMLAAIFSNSIWFLTFRELVLGDMNFILFIPYLIGSISGSVYGMSIAMKIEKWLGASADAHLNKPKYLTENNIENYLRKKHLI